MEGRKIVTEKIADYLSSAYGTDKTEAENFVVKNTTDTEYEAQKVQREAIIEKEDILDKSVSKVYNLLLKYQEKYGKGFFEEGWSGYEDNYFFYSYEGFETTEEIATRIRKSLICDYRDYLEKKKEKEKINEEIAKLKKKLAEL